MQILNKIIHSFDFEYVTPILEDTEMQHCFGKNVNNKNITQYNYEEYVNIWVYSKALNIIIKGGLKFIPKMQ